LADTPPDAFAPGRFADLTPTGRRTYLVLISPGDLLVQRRTVKCRETVGYARKLLGGNSILLENHIGRFVADAEQSTPVGPHER
jgi:hypothetical protein